MKFVDSFMKKPTDVTGIDPNVVEYRIHFNPRLHLSSKSYRKARIVFED